MSPRTRTPKTALPKHRRVRELLRRQIASGRYPIGARLPTETELPRLLRAGKQTVVRALNDLVREGLIVRRRGDGTYVAPKDQPPLVPGRHINVGLLWHRSVYPDRLASQFQGAITRGLLAAWGLEGIEPEWPRAAQGEPTRARWTSVSRGLTVEALGEAAQTASRRPPLRAVREARYDALAVLSIIEEEWLAALLDLGLPTVIVDFPNERFASRADQVYVDPQPAFRAAVRRLAERGAQRIHFIGGRMSAAPPREEMPVPEVLALQERQTRIDPDSFLRLSAFRAALDEGGLHLPEEAVHFLDFSAASRDALCTRWFALPAERRPDGLVCHSLGQAEAFMGAFAARGAPLLAAAVLDGSYAGPVLPIRIDGQELGRTAAELLSWRLQRPGRPPLRVGVPMTFAEGSAVPAAVIPLTETQK